MNNGQQAVVAAPPAVRGLMPLPEPAPMPLTEEEKTGLWRELDEANAGYQARDSLVPELFGRVIATFTGLGTLLLGFNAVIATAAGPARLGVVLIVSTAGFFALLALGEDLASTGRVKQNMRERARRLRLELRLPERVSAAEKAPKRRIERLVAWLPGSGPEAEIALYVRVSYLLLALWAVLSFVVVRWGGALALAGFGGP